jgi:tetratricopeptide (TPR) repeat protein
MPSHGLSQISCAIALCLLPVVGVAAESATTIQTLRPGCCTQADAEIARWQQNADRLYGQFKPEEAVRELGKILAVDSRNFQALIKLARAHIDIGDQIVENSENANERRLKQYRVAEDYARRAVRMDANSTWGHFWIAAALGNTAIYSPVAKQLELAGEIRAEIEKALTLDPMNGLAYHAYGIWHRKIAEIGGASRVFASLIYGKSLPAGTLEKSIEYLQKAVELNSTVIVSRLELARSYMAKDEWQAARTLLNSIAGLPIQFSDDAKHKQKAKELLSEIKDR